MNDKEQKVLNALKESDKPLKTAEVAHLADIDSKEASKIISKLKKDGFVESPKRCYYQAK